MASILLALSLLSGCVAAAPFPAPAATASDPRSLNLTDAARAHLIPLALYGATAGRPKPLALISHGYGGRNTEHSFIARALAGRGYVVASVQHEIEGDAPMPSTGEPAIVRRPFWERGAASLRFVIAELQRRRIATRAPVVLIGHSNGGDTSMLLATGHPELVRTVFTLDNRRMAVPRVASPRVCSVRSSDQPADPGVLPGEAEQRAHDMVIARILGLLHNDMSDAATPAQQASMLYYLFRCLDGAPPISRP